MISNPGILRGIVWPILASGVALGQSAPRIAPIPRDPLELAPEQIQGAGAAEREHARRGVRECRAERIPGNPAVDSYEVKEAAMM